MFNQTFTEKNTTCGALRYRYEIFHYKNGRKAYIFKIFNGLTKSEEFSLKVASPFLVFQKNCSYF